MKSFICAKHIRGCLMRRMGVLALKTCKSHRCLFPTVQRIYPGQRIILDKRLGFGTIFPPNLGNLIRGSGESGRVGSETMGATILLLKPVTQSLCDYCV